MVSSFTTKIELDLLSDIDKIDFIKKGIRGGISQCVCRYAEAKNKYTQDYNANTNDASFLMYLDANNLYGWAMSQALPHGNFEWVEAENFDLSQINSNVDECYIMEVDLDYPKKVA